MNILLKIFLLAIVMILGFSAVLIGGMLLFIGRAHDFMPAIICLFGGLAVGLLSLWYIIRFNRQFQDNELEEVLKHPERIIAQFVDTETGKNIIISEAALFVDKQHHPFSSFYQTLESWEWKEGKLYFNFQNSAGKYSNSRQIKINPPKESIAKVETWVNGLKEGK